MRIRPITPRLFCLVCAWTLGLLVMIDRAGALILPVDYLLARGWEYVSGAGRYGFARASIVHTQHEYGDLGNMLGVNAYKQWRTNTYTMNSIGFRDLHDARKLSSHILVAGDSFMAGVGNTDSDTFAAQLERSLNQPVESYVPGDLSLLLTEGRFPASVSGSVLVWGRVERNLTADDGEMQKWMNDTACFQETPRQEFIRVTKTRIKHLVGWWMEYASFSPLRRIGQHWFQEVRFAVTGGHSREVIVSDDGSKMLFFAKDVRLLPKTADERGIARVAQAIAHARDCLKARGVDLVFLPIPDKSHVYKSHLPASVLAQSPTPSPEPLTVLDQELRAHGVTTVNLLPAFQAEASTKLLFWKDDTHWNAEGVRLGVEKTIPSLRN